MSVIPLRRASSGPAMQHPDATRENSAVTPVTVITEISRAGTAERENRRRDREEQIAAALTRAHLAGITALWTADHAGSVELARLAGPQDRVLTDGELARFGLLGCQSRRLADDRCRCAVYEQVLVHGTQFDIYRWINLLDLALTWPFLHLPRGIRYEWQRALQAAGLYNASVEYRMDGPASVRPA